MLLATYQPHRQTELEEPKIPVAEIRDKTDDWQQLELVRISLHKQIKKYFTKLDAYLEQLKMKTCSPKLKPAASGWKANGKPCKMF
jgi:hypothetical protein